MNTVEELETKYGISRPTSERMIEQYKSHISEKHGDYTIEDMTYQGDGKRVIKLRCSKCNTE